MESLLDYFQRCVSVYTVTPVNITLDKRDWFIKFILNISDQTFDYIFQSNNTYHDAIFIIDNRQMNVFFTHIRKNAIGFLSVRNADYFAENISLNKLFIFLLSLCQAINIFNVNESDDVFSVVFKNRKAAIPNIQIFTNLIY